MRFGVAATVVVAFVSLPLAAFAYWHAEATGKGVAAGGNLSAPGAPIVTGETSLTLSWSPASVTGGGVVRFHVQRRPHPGSTFASVCGSTAVTPIAGTGCVDVPAAGTWVYRVASVYGGWTTVGAESTPVAFDSTAPTNALSLAGTSGALLRGSTLYYKGNSVGSFTLRNTVTDAGSGPASSTFPAIATTGWTHNAQTVSTPAGGPFVSSTYSWTASPSNPAGHVVTGRDAAGNATPTTLTFASDTIAPVVTTAIARTTELTTPGFIAQGSTYYVYANATDAGSGVTGVGADLSAVTTGQTAAVFVAGTYVAFGTTYSYRSAQLTANASLSAGSKSFTVGAADGVGNIGTNSTSVTVDNTAPATPSAPDLATASDSGSSTTDNITNDTTPMLTGTVEANAIAAVYDGATPAGTLFTVSGTYSIDTTALSAGVHSLTVRATDRAGNVSLTSAALSITIDTVAPVRTAMQMLDTDNDGRVDRVTATFDTTLATSTATAPWTLTNAPSSGALLSVATTTTVATLTLTEGAGAQSTAVGTFTVALATNVAGIRDVAGNAASFTATAPTDAAKPVLISATSANVNSIAGRMQQNDTLTMVFSEPLAAGSVPATATLTEQRSVGSTMTIPGFIASTTINNSYVAAASSGSSVATVTVSADKTTITIKLNAITTTGSGVGTGTGTVIITPVATITDAVGNAANTTTATIARLF